MRIKKRSNIETVKKIDSIDFFKQIYNKSCNSFYNIRVFFLYFSSCSMFFLVFSGCWLISHRLLSTIHSIDNIMFIVSLVLFFISLIPFFISYNKDKKGRSGKYIKYLHEIKIERNLNNKAIDDLLEEISFLQAKYREERNHLLRWTANCVKWLVFPISAGILNNDIHLASVTLVVIVIFLFTLVIYVWHDTKMFEDLDKTFVRNSYMIDAVKRELIYMKSLEFQNKKQ